MQLGKDFIAINLLLLSACAQLPVQPGATSSVLPTSTTLTASSVLPTSTTLTASSILPTATTLTTSASPTAAPTQQAWLNSKGKQADYKTLSECGLQAKINAKQVMAAENIGGGLLDQAIGFVQENMEESDQLTNCMLAKGYAKINATPEQLLAAQPKPKKNQKNRMHKKNHADKTTASR